MSASAQTLLKKELSKEEQNELKQFIVDESDRLNKILTDFLSLSKLRTPKYEEVSLEELLQRVKTAMASSAGEIDVQVSPQNGHSEFLTDRDLLYQLLFNLGNNAVDAVKERCKTDAEFSCSKGVISLTTDTQDGELQISISDNGTGISSESLERIFDPFYTTKETGTGLGLSISHNIAEALGGKLRVVSSKDETAFTISFATTKTPGDEAM
jgi:signal transduction histidine kinase